MKNILSILLALSILPLFCVQAKQVSRTASNASVVEELKYMKKLKKFTKNYSSSEYSKPHLNDFNLLEAEMQRKWTYEFLSNSSSRISFVDDKFDYRIMAEAWIDENKFTDTDKDNLVKNLGYAKENGYNSILVRFDCTEDIALLKQMIQVIKDNGMKVVMVYTGRDYQKPYWNPLIDPQTLGARVQEVAKLSDAMFLTWRAMFVHVKLMPVEFFNFMAYNARIGNPSISIFGEVFYGRIDPLKVMTLKMARVENMNGYVVCGLGFYTSNLDYGIGVRCKENVPQFNELRNIGQVVGVCPFYCSKQNAGISIDKQLQYKKIVEGRFVERGMMTVSYVNDGCDDHQAEEYGTTDNLVYLTK